MYEAPFTDSIYFDKTSFDIPQSLSHGFETNYRNPTTILHRHSSMNVDLGQKPGFFPSAAESKLSLGGDDLRHTTQRPKNLVSGTSSPALSKLPKSSQYTTTTVPPLLSSP